MGEKYLSDLPINNFFTSYVKSTRDFSHGMNWHTYDIVNIGLHFFLKNVRPYAASCSEA